MVIMQQVIMLIYINYNSDLLIALLIVIIRLL